MSDQCPTCYAWTFGSHRCPPRWEVRAEGETKPTTVFALAADEAAEKFVEDYENSYVEYDVASGKETLTVYVRAAMDGAKEAKYIVEGECVPQYHARFVDVEKA